MSVVTRTRTSSFVSFKQFSPSCGRMPLICVNVIVELQILESGRAREVHASTVGPIHALVHKLTHTHKHSCSEDPCNLFKVLFENDEFVDR